MTSSLVVAAVVLLGADDGGVLDFRIVDEHDAAMPGRLTFVTDDDPAPALFPDPDVAPDDLALRRNVVYTLSGAGRVELPAGVYTVYATRGIEWSRDATRLVVHPDRPAAWTARLRREVDTTGWVSGDFHLHTLTYSGHGDSNMPERIISIVGEGVEFAVATDHNHHTDYHPTIDHLHAASEMTAVTGNEVSVPVGHFNAFPLDPDDAPVDADLADANELFRRLRLQPNPFGVVPVIQVNHPRWDGIDYFNIAALDPATGVSVSGRYSDDFDTIEVLNENTAWGYHQAFVDDVDTAANNQSVVRDWFNLLNRGRRYAAVGNSDSHTVHYAFAGYPRNYVPCSTDDPGAIDPVEVARMLRGRRVFTTIGPFVEMRVNGMPMGGDVATPDGRVTVTIRVQAASWIDCDRVHLVVNGDVRETIEVPDTRTPVRLETERRLRLDDDAWIALLVEGDDPLEPIVTGGDRPCRPLAIANPVWVDANADGAWTSPWAQALRAAHRGDSADAVAASPLGRAGPAGRGLVVLAAAAARRPFAAELVTRGLADGDRLVRLCATRAAEHLADPALGPALDAALLADGVDPYLRVALLRAVGATGDEGFSSALLAMLADAETMPPSGYFRELIPRLPGGFVDDWFAIGYFPAPEAGTVLRATLGPETDPDLDRAHAGRAGTTARWRRLACSDSGFLDLRGLDDDPARAENAIACAQTWLHSPDERTVPVALGTDDGSRVALNGVVVYENASRRGARPFEHVSTWRLNAGWNRVLIKVENGTGGFGAYLRVLDDDIRWSARPDPVDP
jgi:hypothetical protein